MTRNLEAWSSTQVREALTKRGIPYECFTFPKIVARLAYKPYFKVNGTSILDDLDALIIRPIGRGSLEELVFRMDMLYKLERQGFYMVNPPTAIEHCVDKYDILALLEDVGVPVPRTLATESVNEALKAFNELGGDMVVKPIFGSTRTRRNTRSRRRHRRHNFQSHNLPPRRHLHAGIRSSWTLRHTRIRYWRPSRRIHAPRSGRLENQLQPRSQTCTSRNQQRIRRISHKIRQGCGLQNRRRRHLGRTRRTTHRRRE